MNQETKIQELEAKIAELTTRLDQMATPVSSKASTDVVPVASADVEDATSSRRGMLKLAGAAAAGAAAIAVVGKSTPAAANNGFALVLGTAGDDGSTAAVAAQQASGQTVHEWIPNAVTGRGVGFLFQAGTVYQNSDAAFPCALAGWTTNAANPNGVYGYTNQNGGHGVIAAGFGTGSSGLLANGSDFAIEAGNASKANMFLKPLNGASAKVSPPARADAHVVGELESAGGDLWFCVAAGTPGTWRKITGPAVAGAFHALTPGRVYDSRQTLPTPGALGSGSNRTLSVADRRDANATTGAVVQADFVPAGATAIAANVTVTGTIGGGFLVCNPGGVTTVGASTINWSAAGQTLANGVILTLDATRKITVVAGGGGATDFIIDVTGYFL